MKKYKHNAAILSSDKLTIEHIGNNEIITILGTNGFNKGDIKWKATICGDNIEGYGAGIYSLAYKDTFSGFRTTHKGEPIYMNGYIKILKPGDTYYFHLNMDKYPHEFQIIGTGISLSQFLEHGTYYPYFEMKCTGNKWLIIP